jgi:hypothetical protein
MAYNDLQQNQAVSFTNLQSGVSQGIFTAKTTIPSSNRQVTKAQVNTYVNINTSLPSYVAKASNTLITKGDLSGITSTSSYIVYGLAAASDGNTSPTTAYKSIDGGATFSALSGLTYTVWTAIAGDQTGTYIAVVSYYQSNTVYISNNGGASFTARSLNNTLLGFHPTGISMSNNGQYIAVAGVSSENNNKSARVAVSDNYGTSFFTSFAESATYEMVQGETGATQGKISVSGNGEYITAIYVYTVRPGFPNNSRPWSYRVVSSNYGASFTKTGVTEFAGFGDIALDYTGQNQFLTSDWTKPGIFGTIGIKAFVSNNYGASFNEKFSNTNTYFGLDRFGHVGFFSATITDDGKTMVGATTSQVWGGSSEGSPREPLVLVSSNYGANFTSTEGYTGNEGIAGGTAIISGITNNYIVMMLNNIGQFNYSNIGGVSFIPKATTARRWIQIYRKALVYNPNNYPGYGTFIESVCVNCDLYAIRADGNGGTYQAEVLQYNTEACCFGGPGGGGGGGGGGDIV